MLVAIAMFRASGALDILTIVLKPFTDETLSALEKSLGLVGQADNGFQDKVEDFKFKGYIFL